MQVKRNATPLQRSNLTVNPAVMPHVESPERSPTPTPLQLFLGFSKIASFGFGGVLAWARRIIVQDKRWQTPEEFNELLALCQILPGGNIINFSVMYGARCAGLTGSLAALAGLIGPPMLLMMVAGTLYARFGSMPELHGVLGGLAAAAAGLILATAVQMIEPMARRRFHSGHVIAAVTFLAVGVFRLPLLWVMAVLVPIGIAGAWWERR
jgi:chromate transporter